MNESTRSSGHVVQMIQTHPQQPWLAGEQLAQAVQAVNQCALVCTSCADACLAEQHVQQLVRCIRLNLDCADICHATASVLMRLNQPDASVLRALLQACQTACQSCGQECQQHAQMHEHCRVCAESCQHCAQVCAELMQRV